MTPTNSIVNALFKTTKYGHMIRTSQTVLPNKFGFPTTTGPRFCLNKCSQSFNLLKRKFQIGPGLFKNLCLKSGRALFKNLV